MSKTNDELDEILEFDEWCRCGNDDCQEFVNYKNAKALIADKEQEARIDSLNRLNQDLENDPCCCSHLNGIIDTHLAQLKSNQQGENK